MFKKISLRSIFLLFVILALPSCFSHYSKNERYNEKKYDKGGLAYIVIGASNNANQQDFSVDNYFVFKNEDGKKIKLYVNNGENASFIIKPGNYKLVSYSIRGSITHGNMTRSVNIDFKDSIQANFSLKEGEAIYLGNLNTKIINVKRNIFKKIFNFGVSLQEIEYQVIVEDKYKEINNKSKFEKEAKKEIQIKLMTAKLKKDKDISTQQ